MPINRDGRVARRILARIRWELKYRYIFIEVPLELKLNLHRVFMWADKRMPWNRR